MSQYNHTPLSTGAAANAATFNTAFGELDAAIKKNNYVATSAPTTGDDTADGYSVGSRWFDVTNDRAYVALDVTLGAAIWALIAVPLATRTIDSSGRTVHGYTAVIQPGTDGITPKFQVWGDSTANGIRAGIAIGQFSADTRAPYLMLVKSRGATVGAYDIVNDGDTLGNIEFVGSDGSDIGNTGARIRAIVDGTPGANDLPTRMEFLTAPDGSVSPLIRLTLEPDGSMGFGATVDYGSGVRVISIQNAATNPSTNPTGGGVLYCDGGALKYRGSSGTTTTLGAA